TPRPAQPRELAQVLEERVRNGRVRLDGHERVLVTTRAVHAHRREADVLRGETARDRHNGAGLVAREHDERVVVATEGNREAIQLAHLDPAAADRRTCDVHRLASACQLEYHAVRMRAVPEVD